MRGLGWFSLLSGALGMLACSGAARQPTELSSRRLTADSIADRYIVVFKKGATRSGVAGQSALDVAASVGARYGGRVVHAYKHALQGAAMILPHAAVESLRHDTRVAYVEPDGIVSINAAEGNATWGIDRVDQRQLPLNLTYVYPDQAGQGVHAYVLDTGIYAGHSEFALTGGGSRVVPGYDFIDDDGDPDDCHGHGTHVAGTLGGNTYGLAKQVTLHSVRVLDCDGFGAYSTVIAGIDWVTANHATPAVANMSLGGDYSQAINDAVTNSIAVGITYGIAAGNFQDDACYYSPASTPNAITVGATDSSDATYYYSNYGSCLDLFAPGENITSAWIGTPAATNTITGTSMAAPHVVGSAALWLGLHPTATPAEVTQALIARATPNLVLYPGYGSPNRLLYMGNLASGGTAPQVASVGATLPSLDGGSATTGTLLLTEPAPAGGITVALSSSHAALVVPGTLLVPAGSFTANFPITTSAVSSPIVVTLSASYPDVVTVTSTVTVYPAPTPATLTLSPSSVVGGFTATAKVTLSGPAPTGGAVVALASSNTAIATVPATMTIPAGSTSGQITVATLPRSAIASVSISAGYHGLFRSASLTVNTTPTISSLSMNPSKLEGGGSATGTVGLTVEAPAGGSVVALASSNPAATVPASVTVVAGATSADFPITTTAVGAQTAVTITGTCPAGFSNSAVLNVLPAPTPTSLALTPAAVSGGDSSTGTVTLSGPAPAGGATVTLESSNPSVASVPATLVIAAGTSTGTFPLTTVALSTTETPTIAASFNGLTTTSVLTVKRVLPVGNAIYDTTLRAPKCGLLAPTCDSGWLIDGKAQLGPELDAPNTIRDSCSDGASGIYHYQTESIDRLKIFTVDGSNLAPGKQVTIEASVYALIFINDGAAEDYPSDDRLDLYLTTNASATPLTWVLLTPTSIIPPSQVTEPVLTLTFTLPSSGASNLWAIRGNYRWSANGGQGVCQPGSFVDYDDLIFTVDTTGPFNQAPVVNAGANQTVTLPAAAALAGTATDDGLPNPPGAVTTTWSKVSGPGTVTFANASALATTATFSTAGSYSLRLTASDGGVSSSDDVDVTVNGTGAPCAGICSNPTSFTIAGYYQSGSLGTGTRCYQTLSTIHGGRCGWFANPRTLKVNGTTEACNGSNWSTIPAAVNGGYCIQISAGNYASAYFSAW